MESRDRLLLSAALVGGAAGLAWFWKQQQQSPPTMAKNDAALPTALAASPYQRQLALAVQLARRAGQNMYKYCDQAGNYDLGISEKTAAEDFFTIIDVENETMVTNGIRQAYPHDQIIGEESVGTAGVPPLTTKPTWIIDPIDGTTNFASGLPLTCVSIGYCVNGVPVVGVVYAPMTDEFFVAAKGRREGGNGKGGMEREGAGMKMEDRRGKEMLGSEGEGEIRQVSTICTCHNSDVLSLSQGSYYM